MRFSFFLFAPFALFIVIAANPTPPGLFVLGRDISFVQRVQLLLLKHLQIDFWAPAKALGDKIKTYAEEELHDAALKLPAASAKLDEFKATMSAVVTASTELRSHIKDSANISLATEENLLAHLEPVFEKFQAEFTLPLPDDQNARYEERVKMVDWLMNEVEYALVGILPIPEAEARERFQEIKPHIRHVLLVTGQLIDNHPMVFEIIMFSGAALLIPESWLLRPVLGLFGFGPYGPVKGSSAAWAQRRFWGAEVAKGSWFAGLQKAGMGIIPPGTWGNIVGSIGVIGIISHMCRH